MTSCCRDYELFLREKVQTLTGFSKEFGYSSKRQKKKKKKATVSKSHTCTGFSMTSYTALHLPLLTLNCPPAQSSMLFPEATHQFIDFLQESCAFPKTSDI